MTTSVNSRRPSVHKRLVTPLFWNGFCAITSLCFRRRSKRIAFFEISGFFYICYMQIFNFRDGHVTTFRHPLGAYICQMPGHRLQTSNRHTLKSLGFQSVPLVCGKTVSCRLCPSGQSNGTPKREKCCFWIWLRPRYKIAKFFTIAPVLTSTLTVCRRNCGDPYTSRSIWFGLEIDDIW